MADKINIGKVAVTPGGSYDPEVEYDILVGVRTSDNRYWISKKANNLNHTPAEGSEWWELSLDGKFAQEQAAAAQAAATAALEAKATLQEDIDGIRNANANILFKAMARVNGDTDPAGATFYGTDAALLSTLSHLKLGIFKNGALVHELAPGRLTADKYGNAVAIDGTEGDVLLYTDEDIYADRLTGTVDGSEKNIIGLGLVAHELGNVISKKFKPFAFTPHYTVNAQIGDDVRSQAHCCYNPNVAGTYNAPTAFFKQTLKPNGNGYFHQYMTSISSSVQARNKNEDPAVRGNYMGLYHEFLGFWLTAMYLELGTYDFTQPNLLGYGLTNTAANASTFADTDISAVSGAKIIKSDNTALYLGTWGQLKLNSGAGSKAVLAGIAGDSYYGVTECLEAQRVLDQIKANNLVSYIGSSTNIFTDGGATVITNGTVDLNTGVGMDVGKKYYTVRNVPGCQGMADGVMTAVVNIYVKVEVADGVCDSSGNDLTGAICIFKFSHGIYRGLDFLSGCFYQLEGCHYTTRRESGSNSYIQSFYAAESPSDVPVITNASTYYGTIDSGLDLIKNYTKFFEKSAGSGWVGSADFNASLFAHKTISGGQHDHECAYLWNDGHCYGSGVNSYPEEGTECVNASVAGCAAADAIAGRSLYANDSVVNSYYYFAGGFAIPSPDLGR